MVLVPSIRIAYSSPSSKKFASATQILHVGSYCSYETKTVCLRLEHHTHEPYTPKSIARLRIYIYIYVAMYVACMQHE